MSTRERFSRSRKRRIGWRNISPPTPLLACPREEKSEVEKLGDKAKDALDLREHEKLKDAGEDAKDAVKDAGAAVKEEADSLKEEVE